jgi:ABC-type branched-subunit amino acid transport system ATPase component
MPLAYPAGLAGIARNAWERFLARVAASVDRRAAGADERPLVVSHVSKRFGGLVVLDDVAVDVGAGEIVGLIGPNGAGKTTLMNVISGDLAAEAGSVRIFGREVSAMAPEFRAHLGLGRNYQEATLFAGLTAREAIQVALSRSQRVGVIAAMLRAPWVRDSERRSRQRADEILDRLGLMPWADTLTGELSTGTRRICELAAQLAAAPRVLLLDEPTAGVAQREAEAFGPLLRRIRDELDCSVLIVEHDMPLLMGVCDRIYAMDTGQVIAEGTPAEMREHPEVIASYLGTGDAAIARSGARASAR